MIPSAWWYLGTTEGTRLSAPLERYNEEPNRLGKAGLHLPPLPHHPACGFDGASLAQWAVPPRETVCLSLQSALPAQRSLVGP